MTRFTLATSLLVSLSIGCGSVEPGTPGPGPDPDPDPDPVVDTTAPAIVKSTPGAGEAGVPADAAIVIEFSEPMDKASVEAAYASADLPVDAVTMSWNDAGDTLTITPKQPLARASGVGFDPSIVTAKAYALSLAASAKDEAGNALESPLELAFTTQKRMIATLSIVGDLTRYRDSTGTVAPVNDDLRVGDNNLLAYRGFVTYNLAPLPDGIEIDSANMKAYQSAVNGTPYELGVVNTVHITYTAVNSAAWNAPSLGTTMAPLSTTATIGARAIDVSDALADDYANRAARMNRSQYRFEFPVGTTGDNGPDNLVLARANFAISLHYLAP